MTDDFVRMMDDGLKQLNFTLTGIQKQQFYNYYELLNEWNRVMNLTTITQLRDVINKHFVDSLSLVIAISDFGQREVSVIDVGTGAGFPGIPLKIAFPDIRITLLDSLNKRVRFLNLVFEKLGLRNIEAIHGRAEDYGRERGYRESYDYCVSRAVANLSTLSEYCLAFVKKDGYFISYKSGKAEEEIAEAKGAIKKLGGAIESVENFVLVGAEVNRSLIKIRKTCVMSQQYPRKAGTPSKSPLV